MRFACPRLRVEETLLVICRRGIAEHTVHHPRVGVQFMHHGFPRRHQVADLPATGDEVVGDQAPVAAPPHRLGAHHRRAPRSEEHTSELQSLMRISYAVFCLKKKTSQQQYIKPNTCTTL